MTLTSTPRTEALKHAVEALSQFESEKESKMKNSLATRLVLAAVFSLGVAGLAQAKDLQPQEYALVRVGMTQDQVKQALGQPAQARHFSLSNLTVWSYKTSDYFQRAGDRGYDVDFDADGKVIAAGVINHPDVASRR